MLNIISKHETGKDVEGGDCGLTLPTVLPLQFALRDSVKQPKPQSGWSASGLRFKEGGPEYKATMPNINSHILHHSVTYS
jgi:hypothetical protein